MTLITLAEASKLTGFARATLEKHCRERPGYGVKTGTQGTWMINTDFVAVAVTSKSAKTPDGLLHPDVEPVADFGPGRSIAKQHAKRIALITAAKVWFDDVPAEILTQAERALGMAMSAGGPVLVRSRAARAALDDMAVQSLPVGFIGRAWVFADASMVVATDEGVHVR